MPAPADLEMVQIYNEELQAYGQSPRGGLKYLPGWEEVGAVEHEAEDGLEGEAFQPAQHNVTDVVAYLELANDAQRAAVLDLERTGKQRKTVLDWEPADQS